MQAEIDAEAATAKSPRFSWIVVAAAGVVFALSAPLAREYGVRLLFVRGLSGIAIQLAAGGLSLGVLVWALAKFPRRTALVLAATAAVQTAASGNLAALLEAAAIGGCVVLLGDAATRAVRGENPRGDEWPTTFVAGAAAASILVLGLAETGLLHPAVLAGIAAVILAARWRRIPDYSRLLLRNDAPPRDEIPGSLRILWTVLAVAAIAIVWLRVLEPDFYYDALAYHLPEARDVARHLRVDVAADLFPQSLLWRMHENFLALGFFLPQGERVVRFLNFFFGLAGFGASLLLARRVGDGASRSLVLLALVGFPVILFQLYSSNADWPAAAFVTAGAAEIAASRGRPRRGWLGAALFGAGVATKPYALCAAPALAILFARRGNLRPGRTAAAIAFSLLPVLPWMLWSARHSGSLLAPARVHSAESLPGGKLVLVSGETASPPHASPKTADDGRSVAGFLRLPYDLTFHSTKYQGFRDGYFGLLALTLMVGILGWRPVPALLFTLAAAAALIPWYFGPPPSVRYLFPIYPLYAVFTAAGITRGTRRFEGRAGLAAGAALSAAVLALPVGYHPTLREIRASFGMIKRDEVLARELPSYLLWKFVEPEDRAILISEHDRFYCPASLAYRTTYIPVRLWRTPEEWRLGLERYGITVVVYYRTLADRSELIPDLVANGTLRLVARNRNEWLYRVVRPEDRAGTALGEDHPSR